MQVSTYTVLDYPFDLWSINTHSLFGYAIGFHALGTRLSRPPVTVALVLYLLACESWTLIIAEGILYFICHTDADEPPNSALCIPHKLPKERVSKCIISGHKKLIFSCLPTKLASTGFFH